MGPSTTSHTCLCEEGKFACTLVCTMGPAKSPQVASPLEVYKYSHKDKILIKSYFVEHSLWERKCKVGGGRREGGRTSTMEGPPLWGDLQYGGTSTMGGPPLWGDLQYRGTSTMGGPPLSGDLHYGGTWTTRGSHQLISVPLPLIFF